MRKLGCAPLAALMIFIFVLLFGAANEGVGFYYTKCNQEDSNFLSCLMDEMSREEEEPEPEEGTVVATGVYEYKGHSITATMNIPLQGGAVTGTVSGTCEGNFNGTYSASTGVVSANMGGVCAPFFVNIPASASFTGTVNKTGKTVPVSFNGRGGGITHEGSMTLTWR